MLESSARPKTGDWVVILVSVAMIGAPEAIPQHLGHIGGLLLFYGGLAGAIGYPIIRWGIHLYRWLRRHAAADGTSAATWKPMFEAVAYVAQKIKDADEKNCWPQARHALRQAALNGEIAIRGRRSANLMGESGYSKVETDIPKSYWETADIGALATSKDVAEANDCHTFPHQFSSGHFGEKIFLYARLQVDWNGVTKKWP